MMCVCVRCSNVITLTYIYKLRKILKKWDDIFVLLRVYSICSLFIHIRLFISLWNLSQHSTKLCPTLEMWIGSIVSVSFGVHIMLVKYVSSHQTVIYALSIYSVFLWMCVCAYAYYCCLYCVVLFNVLSVGIVSFIKLNDTDKYAYQLPFLWTKFLKNQIYSRSHTHTRGKIKYDLFSCLAFSLQDIWAKKNSSSC